MWGHLNSSVQLESLQLLEYVVLRDGGFFPEANKISAYIADYSRCSLVSED